jgi:hypothetical protein
VLQTTLDLAYLCMGENKTHQHITKIKSIFLALHPTNINHLNFKTNQHKIPPFSNMDWSKDYCTYPPN